MSVKNISLILCGILILATCITPCTANSAITWGLPTKNLITMPQNNTDIIDISLSSTHYIATYTNGSFSCHPIGPSFLCPKLYDIPHDTRIKFTKIQAFDNWGNLGMLENGTLATWGYGFTHGYILLPDTGTFSDITCRYDSCLAERLNGTFIRLKSDFNPRLTSFKVNSPSVGAAVGKQYSFVIVPNKIRPYQGRLVCEINDKPDAFCKVPDGEDFVKIVMGDEHTMALKSNGGLVIWGDSTYGQIPACSGLFFGGNKFVDIAAGARHSSAVDTYGRLWVWGDNRNGQQPIWDTLDSNSVSSYFQWNHFRKVYAQGDNNIALVDTIYVDPYNTSRFLQPGRPIKI